MGPPCYVSCLCLSHANINMCLFAPMKEFLTQLCIFIHALGTQAPLVDEPKSATASKDDNEHLQINFFFSNMYAL